MKDKFPLKTIAFLSFLSLLIIIGPVQSLAQTCTSIDYNKPTIAAGWVHSVGLKEDGTVVSTGGDFWGLSNVSSWENIKAVAAADWSHTLGLKEDGTVVAVGRSYEGQLNVSDWTNIKAIAAGDYHTAGLKEDGTVVAVGRPYEGQLNVSDWTNIKAIAAGDAHTVGLKEDGTVVAVGSNYYGQLNVSSWTNIKAIAAAEGHTVGLKKDGTVVAVGWNRGQLNVSSWNNIIAIATGGANYIGGALTVGLKKDGTVVIAGYSIWPLDVSSWTNITAIAAGAAHVIGLKEDGTVVGTGHNGGGQINVSDWPNIRQPDCLNTVEISPPSSITAIDTSCDNGGITLSWELSADDPIAGSGASIVSGYNIYRSDMAGGPYTLIGNVNSGVGSYNDNTAVTGATYYYIVRATDGVDESADSNEASAASARNLPLAPTNLTATDTPYDLGGSITLSWTKSTDDGTGLNNVTSYKIYRYSAANGNIATLASVQAGTTGYVDNTTVDIDTYYYSIRAYDSQCSAESEASNLAMGQSVNNFTALQDYIGTLPGISAELLGSLTSKVENAIASFDGGNIEAAENKLNALLNQISAQSGKKIDTDTAALLTVYVQNLISHIRQ